MSDQPVLYLLPGLLCDAIVWQGQIPALTAAGWDVRVADFRGFSSIPDMARSVLDDAPVPFAVAGHSLGGRVALEVVRQQPGRVSHLALLDTGTHACQPGEPEKRQQLLDLARTQGMTALAARWLPPMVHPDRLSDAPFMAALTTMVERMSPAIFERQVQALLTRPDAAPVLPAITCPTLLGVGRQDGWSPPEQHLVMARSIPHARLHIYDNSGHMAPMEAPDAVARSLCDWLKQGGTGR